MIVLGTPYGEADFVGDYFEENKVKTGENYEQMAKNCMV